MAQEMQSNQFGMTAMKGQLAAIGSQNTISAVIDPGSVSTLYPGDAVVLKITTGNAILVDKALATDTPIGFILTNPKLNKYAKNDNVEIGIPGTIINV